MNTQTLILVAALLFLATGAYQLLAIIRRKNEHDAFVWRIQGVEAGERAQRRIDREKAQLERWWKMEAK
jgi:hypothetical protein